MRLLINENLFYSITFLLQLKSDENTAGQIIIIIIIMV